MTIAQPFMGKKFANFKKSRESRQNGSFVPAGTLMMAVRKHQP